MIDTLERLGMDTPAEDLRALEELARYAYMGKSAYSTDRGEFVAVEVGSYAGLTSRAIADAVPGKLYCVDTWAGSLGVDYVNDLYGEHGGDGVFRTFCKNMGRRLFTTVFPLRGESALWAGVFPRKVDFLFLDAGHEYEDVLADLRAWSRVVRPGGLVACHDFVSEMHPGVARAVLEFAPRDRLRLIGATVACWETEGGDG